MNRNDFLTALHNKFEINPIVAILGPRQCGKTTLSEQYSKVLEKQVHYFDLENPNDLAQLENPLLTFEGLTGVIVIDEIQRRPELFPILRVVVDQNKDKNFLILGSASRDLIQQSSETLAGRISYLELTPFNYNEVNNLKCLWLRGGFPKAYLAKSEANCFDWLADYVATFLERDIPNLGFKIPPAMLRRFWLMLTHYHGQIFNASEIGKSLGISHTTVKHYLDILTGTFMVRALTPWFENIGKRQVKSPKLFFRDSGIYHFLLGITESNVLLRHPKLGASWEGFALEEIIRFHCATPEETYFWGVHGQAELDLLLIQRGKRLGFEIKYTDFPKLTTSMRHAYELLNLDQLTIIYPGKKSFPIAENINAMPLEEYLRTK